MLEEVSIYFLIKYSNVFHMKLTEYAINSTKTSEISFVTCVLENDLFVLSSLSCDLKTVIKKIGYKSRDKLIGHDYGATAIMLQNI